MRLHALSAGVALSITVVASLTGHARAQAPAFPWEGEVTGTNVNVRSGEGTSFYAITKLNTGDRVLVLGERHGWYSIVPPAGTYSFIEKSMINLSPGGKEGTVKIDGAPVRAGSQLVASKSTTQLVLPRSSIVTILGEADGFYKIAPPNGARVYITRQYVKPVAENLRTGLLERYLAANPAAARTSKPAEMPVRTPSRPAVDVEAPVPSPNARRTAAEPAIATRAGATHDDPAESTGEPVDIETSGPPDVISPADQGIVDVDDAPPIQIDERSSNAPAAANVTPAAPVEPKVNKFQALLETAESELNGILEKPASQRDYTGLLARYQEIAEQNEEFVPSEFAKIRIRQLSSLADLQKAQVALKTQGQEVEEFSARMDAKRMEIRRERAQQVAVKFDLEGELRRSFAFPPEKRRYRLVDPARQVTIAYVDIPLDVKENAEHMIGRLVGIHTSGQQYSPAARVPIAIASAITDLTPLRQQPADGEGQHSSLNPMEPQNKPATGANTTVDTVEPPPLVDDDREALVGSGEEEN